MLLLALGPATAIEPFTPVLTIETCAAGEVTSSSYTWGDSGTVETLEICLRWSGGSHSAPGTPRGARPSGSGNCIIHASGLASGTSTDITWPTVSQTTIPDDVVITMLGPWYDNLLTPYGESYDAGIGYGRTARGRDHLCVKSLRLNGRPVEIEQTWGQHEFPYGSHQPIGGGILLQCSQYWTTNAIGIGYSRQECIGSANIHKCITACSGCASEHQKCKDGTYYLVFPIARQPECTPITTCTSGEYYVAPRILNPGTPLLHCARPELPHSIDGPFTRLPSARAPPPPDEHRVRAHRRVRRPLVH